MAGVSVSEGGSGRRNVDSEVMLVPMIDLLICTIAFLLLTAVWSHESRLAVAPSTGPTGDPSTRGRLVVDARDRSSFRLEWRVGGAVIESADVARAPVREEISGRPVVRYPTLATDAERIFKAHGEVGDLAMLKVANDERFIEVAGIVDALSAAKSGSRSAMTVSLAGD